MLADQSAPTEDRENLCDFMLRYVRGNRDKRIVQMLVEGTEDPRPFGDLEEDGSEMMGAPAIWNQPTVGLQCSRMLESLLNFPPRSPGFINIKYHRSWSSWWSADKERDLEDWRAEAADWYAKENKK
ncbi:MAG: hypothetical protein AAB074_16825 [Planctomycetota bacterium]